MGTRKKHLWSNEPIHRIDVTAFAGIMLTLFLLFWAREVYRPDLLRPSADLVNAEHALSLRAAAREDAMIVTIQRDGRILFRDQPMSAAELSTKVKQGLRSHAEPRVYIQADRRVKYREILRAVEQIRAAGVENIAFLTSPI